MKLKYFALSLALLLPSCGITRMIQDAKDHYAAIQPQIEEAKGVVQAAGPLLELIRTFMQQQKPELEGIVASAKDRIDRLIVEAKLSLAEVKQAEAIAQKKGDLDGDGKISGLTEWLAYLTALAVAVMEIARRKMATTVAQQVVEVKHVKEEVEWTQAQQAKPVVVAPISGQSPPSA